MKRSNVLDTRSCRPPNNKDAHRVRWDCVRQCEGCHSNICYEHFILRGVHSYELLLGLGDSHYLHGNDGLLRLAEGLRATDPVLVLVNITHFYCASAREELAPGALRAGFYDAAMPEVFIYMPTW